MGRDTSRFVFRRCVDFAPVVGLSHHVILSLAFLGFPLPLKPLCSALLRLALKVRTMLSLNAPRAQVALLLSVPGALVVFSVAPEVHADVQKSLFNNSMVQSSLHIIIASKSAAQRVLSKNGAAIKFPNSSSTKQRGHSHLLRFSTERAFAPLCAQNQRGAPQK